MVLDRPRNVFRNGERAETVLLGRPRKAGLCWPPYPQRPPPASALRPSLAGSRMCPRTFRCLHHLLHVANVQVCCRLDEAKWSLQASRDSGIASASSHRKKGRDIESPFFQVTLRTSAFKVFTRDIILTTETDPLPRRSILKGAIPMQKILSPIQAFIIKTLIRKQTAFDKMFPQISTIIHVKIQILQNDMSFMISSRTNLRQYDRICG